MGNADAVSSNPVSNGAGVSGGAVSSDAGGPAVSGSGPDGDDIAVGQEFTPRDIDGTVETPRVTRRGVKPIKPAPREHTDEHVVQLDFGEKRDVTEEKDKSIRDLGWDEYGKKLSERNEQDPDAQ